LEAVEDASLNVILPQQAPVLIRVTGRHGLRLSGRVVDTAGVPAQARVILNPGGLLAATDPQGRFSFRDVQLAPARHRVTASTASGAVGTTEVSLDDDDAEIVVTVK
jgi:hypothetical protein